jgi:hypothetical protein
MNQYRFIESWNEEYLLNLPKGETEYFEYKSSKTPVEKLKEKISIAASAFWNSGGGVFVVGLNNSGVIDGGIPETIGRQNIRDWVDQVISTVTPVGIYEIKTISPQASTSLIHDSHVVLAIAFEESIVAPHMACDNKYYIRAGTHSVPANHFLIEAIRARRGIQKPVLRGLLRMHDEKSYIVQLVVIALNQSALNVELSFEPLPKIFAEHDDFGNKFPLQIPIIEQNHPFKMDISMFPGGKQVFGDSPVYLKLEYQSLLGEKFSEKQVIDPNRSLPPMQSGQKTLDEIEKTLRELTKEVKNLGKR